MLLSGAQVQEQAREIQDLTQRLAAAESSGETRPIYASTHPRVILHAHSAAATAALARASGKEFRDLSKQVDQVRACARKAPSIRRKARLRFSVAHAHRPRKRLMPARQHALGCARACSP
jgi:hypothetical protein